jgi:hypothetical protein
MATYVTRACSVDGCGNEFDTRKDSEIDECPACRSSHYYWRQKRPAEIVRRRQRLQLFRERLNVWYTSEGKKK